MTSNNADDLKEKSQEILDFAQNQGFSIFHGRELVDNDYARFEWDSSKDWKEFFTIAKNEGVRVIVANIDTFDSDKEHLIRTVRSAMEERDELEKDEDVDFKKYDGKVGLYQFLWVKDGIKYSLSEMTDWCEEYKELDSALRTEYAQQARIAFREEFLHGHDGEIPAILKNQSEEELAKELLEFIEKESPNASRYEVYTLSRLFWSNKGLFAHGASPQADAMRRRIDMKAEKMFEQKQSKEEKERMPKLVEQCLEWARKNGLMKLTQGEVGAFVSESDISLSRDGQRLLWQKVNIELKTR